MRGSLLHKANPPEGRFFRGALVTFTADRAVGLSQPVISVQPLADVINNYTGHDGENKIKRESHYQHLLPTEGVGCTYDYTMSDDTRQEIIAGAGSFCLRFPCVSALTKRMFGATLGDVKTEATESTASRAVRETGTGAPVTARLSESSGWNRVFDAPLTSRRGCFFVLNYFLHSPPERAENA